MYAASTSYTEQERKAIHEKSRRNLLNLAMFSFVMVFAGFTSYYVVSMDKKSWVSIELPHVFWVSTAVILLSSVTMNFGFQAVKKGKNAVGGYMLLATLVLGIVFGVCQFEGWKALISNGVFFAGKTFTPGGGMLYVLTGWHLVHILGGLIALAVTATKAFMGRYNPENTLGIQLTSTYWHFVDGLWIYLFIFLTIFK